MTDADAFEAFVRGYQHMVYGLAVRLLGSPAEAEDVAQTVFLRAFERFDVIAASPTAGGWLKTVTTRLCLNHLTRYRSRWRLFSEMGRAGADGTDQAFEDGLPSDAAPALDLERADQQARLEAALRGLPAHQRVPIVLFHFEQHSYQDIAAALSVSVGKVKTDIHRGREALRRHLMDADGTH